MPAEFTSMKAKLAVMHRQSVAITMLPIPILGEHWDTIPSSAMPVAVSRRQLAQVKTSLDAPLWSTTARVDVLHVLSCHPSSKHEMRQQSTLSRRQLAQVKTSL